MSRTTSRDDRPRRAGESGPPALRIGRAALLAVACAAAIPARGFVLEDTYTMSPEQRTWYFAGVYDSWLTDPRYAGCAGKLGFERFMQAMGRFVSALPADMTAPARRAYDRMPAALVARLLIDGECSK
jgi:hypothetical protein